MDKFDDRALVKNRADYFLITRISASAVLAKHGDIIGYGFSAEPAKRRIKKYDFIKTFRTKIALRYFFLAVKT
jgi:hypothetical protein